MWHLFQFIDILIFCIIFCIKFLFFCNEFFYKIYYYYCYYIINLNFISFISVSDHGVKSRSLRGFKMREFRYNSPRNQPMDIQTYGANSHLRPPELNYRNTNSMNSNSSAVAEQNRSKEIFELLPNPSIKEHENSVLEMNHCYQHSIILTSQANIIQNNSQPQSTQANSFSQSASQSQSQASYSGKLHGTDRPSSRLRSPSSGPDKSKARHCRSEKVCGSCGSFREQSTGECERRDCSEGSYAQACCGGREGNNELASDSDTSYSE